MSLGNLENLVKTKVIKKEPFSSSEFQGLIESGKKRLKDALNNSLSEESRFDLAYNAAHALALAALRKQGYRPANQRYIVFQALPFTANLTYEWRILDKCHQLRNQAEYEGFFEVDEVLLTDLIQVTQKMLAFLESS